MKASNYKRHKERCIQGNRFQYRNVRNVKIGLNVEVQMVILDGDVMEKEKW